MSIAQVEVDQVGVECDVDQGQEDIIQDHPRHSSHCNGYDEARTERKMWVYSNSLTKRFITLDMEA